MYTKSLDTIYRIYLCSTDDNIYTHRIRTNRTQSQRYSRCFRLSLGHKYEDVTNRNSGQMNRERGE